VALFAGSTVVHIRPCPSAILGPRRSLPETPREKFASAPHPSSFNPCSGRGPTLLPPPACSRLRDAPCLEPAVSGLRFRGGAPPGANNCGHAGRAPCRTEAGDPRPSRRVAVSPVPPCWRSPVPEPCGTRLPPTPGATTPRRPTTPARPYDSCSPTGSGPFSNGAACCGRPEPVHPADAALPPGRSKPAFAPEGGADVTIRCARKDRRHANSPGLRSFR